MLLVRLQNYVALLSMLLFVLDWHYIKSALFFLITCVAGVVVTVTSAIVVIIYVVVYYLFGFKNQPISALLCF